MKRNLLLLLLIATATQAQVIPQGFFVKTFSLATLATTQYSVIGSTTATVNGNISNTGGTAITASGVVWSTSTAPTISSASKTVGVSSSSFSSSLTGLARSTKYYVRAYATNKGGTAYGNELSFTTLALGPGDPYQGGVIAYLFDNSTPWLVVPGEIHGIIAATVDQSPAGGTRYSTIYSDYNYMVICTTEEYITAGIGNTQKVTNIILGGATKMCSDYRGGGYSDWFLPSRDELATLWSIKGIIGLSGSYFSSSQDSNNGNSVYGGIFDYATPYIGFVSKLWSNSNCRAIRFF